MLLILVLLPFLDTASSADIARRVLQQVSKNVRLQPTDKDDDDDHNVNKGNGGNEHGINFAYWFIFVIFFRNESYLWPGHQLS